LLSTELFVSGFMNRFLILSLKPTLLSSFFFSSTGAVVSSFSFSSTGAVVPSVTLISVSLPFM